MERYRVDTTVKIVSADPVKGDVIVRLDLSPQGTLLAEDGVTLTRDLDLSSAVRRASRCTNSAKASG
ncbi:MAG: hypothetical protein ABR526_07895 [Chthoniobacterales bacterium]